MRERGITGLRLRRRVRTTVPEPTDQKVPDPLAATSPPTRRTSATSAISPICCWTTALLLDDGANLYLATAVDFFSRRAAGWAIAEHMRTKLVADALTAAGTRGARWSGAVFHPDRSTPSRTSRSSARAWA